MLHVLTDTELDAVAAGQTTARFSSSIFAQGPGSSEVDASVNRVVVRAETIPSDGTGPARFTSVAGGAVSVRIA